MRRLLYTTLLTALSFAGFANAQTTKPVALGRVDVRGSGPIAAVLIPGYTCDASVFDRLMSEQAGAFTFYAVTLAGFGGTTPPAPDARVLDNADAAIQQLIVDRKLDHPLLIGHSMGATLTYRLLAEHPDEFRAGICIDGLPAYPIMGNDRAMAARAIAAQLKDASDEQFAQIQKRTMATLVTADADRAAMAALAQRTPRATAVQYFEQFMASDYAPLLPKIHVPLLLIVADSPDYGPRRAMYDGYYEKTKAAVNHDGATFCTITHFIGARHFVMLDAPSEFAKAISMFAKGEAVAEEVKVNQPTTAPMTRK